MKNLDSIKAEESKSRVSHMFYEQPHSDLITRLIAYRKNGIRIIDEVIEVWYDRYIEMLNGDIIDTLITNYSIL